MSHFTPTAKTTRRGLSRAPTYFGPSFEKWADPRRYVPPGSPANNNRGVPANFNRAPRRTRSLQKLTAPVRDRRKAVYGSWRWARRIAIALVALEFLEQAWQMEEHRVEPEPERSKVPNILKDNGIEMDPVTRKLSGPGYVITDLTADGQFTRSGFRTPTATVPRTWSNVTEPFGTREVEVYGDLLIGGLWSWYLPSIILTPDMMPGVGPPPPDYFPLEEPLPQREIATPRVRYRPNRGIRPRRNFRFEFHPNGSAVIRPATNSRPKRNQIERKTNRMRAIFRVMIEIEDFMSEGFEFMEIIKEETGYRGSYADMIRDIASGDLDISIDTMVDIIRGFLRNQVEDRLWGRFINRTKRALRNAGISPGIINTLRWGL